MTITKITKDNREQTYYPGDLVIRKDKTSNRTIIYVILQQQTTFWSQGIVFNHNNEKIYSLTIKDVFLKPFYNNCMYKIRIS